MPYHSSLEIANEFIRRAITDGRPITQMHIQKYVYLAHGWTLALTGSALINERFEAWDYGPVERRLYDALRGYGAQPIKRPIKYGDDTPFRSDDGGEAAADLSDDERKILDKIWNEYKDFEAFQLSALTHEIGTPWRGIYKKGQNLIIDNVKIGDYFQDLAAR
jgi:uncharacterized phage-associated protein